MTDDDLVAAVRAYAADQELPGPASSEDVTAFERIVGHPMPQLLRRIYLEVSNGGFGPAEVVSLTDTGDWFSDCEDIAMAYRELADPERGIPPGIVPLMDRGCAMWALIDFKTADGQMWDWDPNLCCKEHALAPLGQSLAGWLTDWLHGSMPDGSYPHRELSARNCPAL
ncbi:SMI1/KNR4 family protein [Streptomyces chengbuensis]|uniref:SMI1/KNR4 family protein n=1 Tax=Streptomyces chengbuensis TaxID=3053466 RepID=UPI0025B34773|nr:SMI1/KNR4 family protein [Streptomyces sp. HUAS CB01]WJY50240.1 SMI1/KNR4 family protein [Streptomyces sp. HUAS CB01]